MNCDSTAYVPLFWCLLIFGGLYVLYLNLRLKLVEVDTSLAICPNEIQSINGLEGKRKRSNASYVIEGSQSIPTVSKTGEIPVEDSSGFVGDSYKE